MSDFAYTSTCCIAWERWRQMSLAWSHQHTLNSLHANCVTGKQRRAISANDSRGRGKKCVIFGCQLSRASLGGSCHIGHCSSFHGCGKPCVCGVPYAGLRSRTIEQGGLSLICHLSRQHLLLSREAQQVMGNSLWIIPPFIFSAWVLYAASFVTLCYSLWLTSQQWY